MGKAQQQAIEQIVAWHRACLAGKNMQEITLEKIGGDQGTEMLLAEVLY